MIRVAIVDDHLLVREGLRRVFEDDEEIVVVAEFPDGRDFVAQRTQLARIDVLFLDITMPNSNGIEIVKEIATWDRGPAVVLLSMHPEESHLREAVQAGARGYLTKDASDAQLREAARSVAHGGLYLSRTGTEVLLTDPDHSGAADRTGGDPILDTLSEQETVVLRRLCEGLTIKEIAYEIDVSEKTVSTYKSRLMKKLGSDNLVDLLRFCHD